MHGTANTEANGEDAGISDDGEMKDNVKEADQKTRDSSGLVEGNKLPVGTPDGIVYKPPGPNLAPLDKNGIPIELHHRGQNPNGPIDEMIWKTHRGKGNENHPVGQGSMLTMGRILRDGKGIIGTVKQIDLRICRVSLLLRPVCGIT